MPDRRDRRAQRQRLVAWIEKSISDNPRLSQAGLARHLGWSPTTIWQLLRRSRNIKVDEVPRIAEYLGTPPPDDVYGIPVLDVPVVGRISMNEWISGDFVPIDRVRIPMIESPEYDGADQTAYEIDPRISREWPAIQQYVVVVPAAKYRPTLRAGDYMVIEAKLGQVHGWRMARVERAGSGTRLVDAAGNVVNEPPVSLVIASISMLA